MAHRKIYSEAEIEKFYNDYQWSGKPILFTKEQMPMTMVEFECRMDLIEAMEAFFAANIYKRQVWHAAVYQREYIGWPRT